MKWIHLRVGNKSVQNEHERESGWVNLLGDEPMKEGAGSAVHRRRGWFCVSRMLGLTGHKMRQNETTSQWCLLMFESSEPPAAPQLSFQMQIIQTTVISRGKRSFGNNLSLGREGFLELGATNSVGGLRRPKRFLPIKSDGSKQAHC